MKREVKCCVCGEIFVTTSNNAKYCPICRYEHHKERARQRHYQIKNELPKNRKPKVIESQTLCWKCANAVPDGKHGCSWSEDGVPIQGWDAEAKKENRYCVRSCPEFIRG